MSTKISNALTLLDGIVGLLAPGGRGREGIVVLKRDCILSDLSQGLKDTLFLTISANKWKLIGPSAYNALYFARAILEVLFDEVPKVLQLPLESQLSIFIRARSWPARLFVRYAKYCTVWPMARFLHNELPAKPEGFIDHPLLASGPLKRVLKNRLVSFNRMNLKLWNSYLQGVKRGCAVVDESFILEALIKHQGKMTAQDTMSDSYAEIVMDYMIRFVPNVEKRLNLKEKSTKRLLRKNGYGYPFIPPVPKLFEASPSAAFEMNRSEGGGREFIRSFQESGLQSMIELGPSEIQELHGSSAPSIYEVIRDHCLHEDYREAWTKSGETCLGFVKRPFEKRFDPEITGVWGGVEVSAVLEPLKVRLITKGEAFHQWIARFFQRGLWKHLQRYPQFSLTGRPLLIDDLDGILIREKKLESKMQQLFGSGYKLWNEEQPEWVSGDFDAATDGVSISGTKIAYETFLRVAKGSGNYPKDLLEILRSVLYEQEVHYPARFKDDLENMEVLQTNGQLMGSVTSFPILCVLNLICYWRACEERWTYNICPQDLPVLINGDDILFRADSYLYELWQNNLKEMMFKLSLGKNYKHASVLMVNSTMFHYQEYSGLDGLGLNKHVFRHVPFFNVGLLTGQSKLTGREDVKIMPLDAIWEEILHGANQPARALKRFIHYNTRLIAKQTRDGEFNLLIPRANGGLGLTVPADYIFHITSFQRRFGSLIREKRRLMIQEGKVPSGLALGIVRESENTRKLTRHHNRVLKETVHIGPLNEFESEPLDTTVMLPILLDRYDPDPILKIRFPRNLGVLREGRCGRMSTKDLMEEPLKVIEVVPSSSHRSVTEIESHSLLSDMRGYLDE